MGDLNVSTEHNEQARRRFMRALLNDQRALELMIEKGMIEDGVRRIGAEQEMFLVDAACRPTNKAIPILDNINDERFTPEIAQFNLEANLTPREYRGDCLGQLENELNEVLKLAREEASRNDARVVLAGILPTIRQMDLTLENMMPIERYRELNETLKRIRGSNFRLNVRGIDELSVTHDNFMLEALNTSFQVHFQVGADEFARLYNIAQAITGPVLAAAVNSGLIHHYRLWHETRIAVFQNSIDTRSDVLQQRGITPRVHFGDRWVNRSVLEIFRDDIARYPVVLTTDFEEDPVAMVERGEVPKLRALMMHNGTVYRWNRPCYGVKNGVPHLRIENRVLPSGPTVLDEVSNAAFFFGLMTELSHTIEDVSALMRFEDAKGNFLNAARTGLGAQMTWFAGKSLPADRLILDELLPLAVAGMNRAGLDKKNILRYAETLEERVKARQTGASWAIRSLTEMDEDAHPDQKVRSIVSKMIQQQKKEIPVHQWPLATLDDDQDWRASYARLGQFMTTELFTVRPDDLIDLAASIMDWRHVRHVPVENAQGELVGLVSHRGILRHVAKGLGKNQIETVAVRDIMRENPVCGTPDMPTTEAIKLMRDKKLSCLPILEDKNLVGIVTDHDLIKLAGKLLEDYLAEYD